MTPISCIIKSTLIRIDTLKLSYDGKILIFLSHFSLLQNKVNKQEFANARSTCT